MLMLLRCCYIIYLNDIFGPFIGHLQVEHHTINNVIVVNNITLLIYGYVIVSLT